MTDLPERQLPGFDPELDLVLDTRMLKALAHPLRLRLRAELNTNGPATASQLAARIGESSGATSYHLRQLAAYGLVVEEPGLGTGRERYWRVVHRSTWVETPLSELPEPEVGAEYLRAVARTYADRVIRFSDSVEATTEQLGPDWVRSWDMSDWLVDVTPEEAAELGRKFHELCLAYRHDESNPRPGTRRVVVQFQILPTDLMNP